MDRLLRALCAAALVAPAAVLLAGANGASHGVHALVGARVVTAPGQVIEKGTVVIRDGLIAAVGSNVQTPPDARVWSGEGLTIYAGLIDAFAMPPEPPRQTGERPAGGPPDGRAAPSTGAAHELPSVRPQRRVVDGGGLEAKRAEALRKAGFTAVHLTPRDGIFRGSSAVVALGEGRLNENLVLADAAQVVALDPQRGGYPESLMGAVAVVRQGFLDAKWYRDALAAYAKAPATVRRPEASDAWAALQPAVTGTQPVMLVADDMLMVLRAAAVAREARVKAFVAGTGDEYKRAAEIAATGLDLVVPLAFPDAPDVATDADAVEVATAPLRHWQNAASNAAALERARVSFALSGNGLEDVAKFRANLALAVERGLSRNAALAAVTTVPARLLGLSGRLGTIEVGKIANLTVVRGDLLDAKADVAEVWVDGHRYEGAKKPDPAATTDADAAAREGGAETAPAAKPPAPTSPPEPPVATPAVAGDSEAFRAASPSRPAAVLVRNATIWTAGPQGTLRNTDLLVRDGKIAAIGSGLPAPAGAVVIDATAKHVSPGIIDAHSHAAILGNVNECTNIITAEVRIEDVINSESVEIYRQLAGGTTMMHLLHGSCNSIGGQASVIKNKWGAPPDQLVFAAAPPTIKFALGENPKRAGGETRYPRTRTGVEQSIRLAFAAARDYKAAWDEWKAGKRPLPPRRDLQHEAVLEVVEGRRDIHSHSYRADEILMLMRVAEEFGVTVRTFQHVLEGYKVADEMAAHGATASGFTDWWAYKFEVYDAIPYNGFLMWDRGVNVSFNSDSAELARRLNTEAAKAAKYGGVPPEEAIKMVTLNPAIQLRIESRVGSLEVGKDADFVIWNASPLSTLAVCEQTWIEGARYFDRAADVEGRAALEQERNALIARARAAKKGAPGSAGPPPTFRYLEEADMSGNSCGHVHAAASGDRAFVGEAERRERQGGAQ